MEKLGKLKSKKPTKRLLKVSSFSLYAARPATTASHGKGFSGPITIVPAEARSRKPSHSDNIDHDAIVPRSPEVSCFGRVKARQTMAGSFSGGHHAPYPAREKKKDEKKGKASILRRLMSRKLDDEVEEKETAATTGPCVGEMRRFSSGRGTLAGFDWRVHVEVADVDDGDVEGK